MLHSHSFSLSSTLGKLSLHRAIRSSHCPRFSMVSTENNGPKMKIPHVMTVAGSDSGAGAGIQADLKACAALGVYCSTVITAVTAQNTVGVQGVNILPEDFVAEQMKSVLSDMEVDVVKTGMLPSVGMVKVLLHSIKEYPVQALVVDPVMVATSGDVLAGSSVLPVFREELLPMADLVTPNLKEASYLLGGMHLESVADMRSAAKLIHDMGPRNVLVKGGDLPASMDAVDVFFDGENLYELGSKRINTRNTHGTGCTLASSIAAELAKGLPMLSAVKIAKRYVETALNYGKDMTIDSGMNEQWGRSITDAVKAAIEGGATIVQLREKNLETRDFIEAAKECVSICHSKGVPILINDRVDVALASVADGVHVGQSDMPVSLVRSLLGPEKIIGVSCKTQEQAQEAWINGADYIGSGGVFPTNTKANNKTIGLDGLKEVCFASKLPVVAIGGIGLSNAHSVMEINVPNLEGVAVVSALFNAECVSSATKQLHEILKQAVQTRK
ncbi:thiamine biosynthetic bifunctional enzyme TH1, chloroplastic-like isoform X2 [Chenopodium quinoa]|uniref:thiamine biosynthetic bifunctional enzyme TH1, chloroplastic-like isoform X2 n=1 Tax=Chenopodium quinoa TaxID=63459 RepID=UPI000B773AF8|nr:thiamine biosynthetic bifunctional enzyme TH1, chloroplastic-like isoform X2 [Chenopodium quinoa]